MSDTTETQTNFQQRLSDAAATIEEAIDGYLAHDVAVPAVLREAMGYSLHAGGKRLRPVMVILACQVCGGQEVRALPAAAAIEMVHTYSLIHDDLPAMDDDDLRRGQPSCHKAFGEATAILAGDGLLTLAFEILAGEIEDKLMATAMIRILAEAAGPAGMIAGQMADMQSHDTHGNVELLEYIHTNKTAKMFAAAAATGAIAAAAGDRQLRHIEQYGLNIGLGFQIADDILDVTASSEELGKTAGKDEQQGKVTYPLVVGIAEAKRLAKVYADKAIESLHIFGTEADVLRHLANELLNRTK